MVRSVVVVVVVVAVVESGGVGALHPPRALVSPGDPVPGGPVALHAAIALHV